jgi:hypothetical protein
MVETYSGNGQTGSSGSVKSPPAGNTNQAASMVQDVTEQARSAGREFKDKAADLAAASADTLKNQASDLADKAKDLASQTGAKVKETVGNQRGLGADYVGNLADTMRRAAREFDSELPIAGAYIRKAAAQVDNVSDAVRTGDFEDLVKGAQSFARRQPTAFLGLSVLAGFGVVRFLKSSADAREQPSATHRSASSGHYPSGDDQGGGYSRSGTTSRPY